MFFFKRFCPWEIFTSSRSNCMNQIEYSSKLIRLLRNLNFDPLPVCSSPKVANYFVESFSDISCNYYSLGRPVSIFILFFFPFYSSELLNTFIRSIFNI